MAKDTPMSDVADYGISIVESLGEGILAFDQMQKVVMANSYVQKLLAKSQDKIMGQSPEFLLADRLSILLNDHKE